LHGATVAAAKRRLANAGCRVGKLKHVHSRTVRKGRVISTKPKAGSRHTHGFKVSVAVSAGR
jgi:serine/threonine-protein kinase